MTCLASGGQWTKSQARSGRSSPSTISSASPTSTRKSSWSASQWYIAIVSPGAITLRFTPSCAKPASPSNPQIALRPSAVYQRDSRALSTNQPSPSGTRPVSVSTSGASSIDSVEALAAGVALGPLAVVRVGVEGRVVERAQDRAGARQLLALDVPLGIPQVGADQRLRALRVGLLDRDHDAEPRHDPLDLAAGEQVCIVRDDGTAVDAK